MGESLVPNETIVALATPPGEGAVALIRMSGSDAWKIASRIFRCGNRSEPFAHARASVGWMMDGDEPVDEVVATAFRGPDSYTGEDVIEFGCHGGSFIAGRIIELLIREGAGPARAGEFTERRFLAGKIDLAQAEAVADLVRSRTESARRMAAYALEGRLSERIAALRERLVESCALIELELDFHEEDVEFASREELGGRLSELVEAIGGLIASFDRGRVYREGVRVAIVGRPNVGKSSLLNALLERDRAIVTEIPGTTRDTVEDELDWNGLLVRVADTAGLRQTNDPIEREGVRRTEQVIERADLVVFVCEGTASWTAEDEAVYDLLGESKKPVEAVINKCDLSIRFDAAQVRERRPDWGWHVISAVTRSGLEELVQRLKERMNGGAFTKPGDVFIHNARHRDALRRAGEFVTHAKEAMRKGLSQEFLAFDLHGAMDALGEITGQTASEEILNRIFSTFCIGK
jgi:tRNA modification GTPase